MSTATSNDTPPPVPQAERNPLNPGIWQIYGPRGTHCGVTEAMLATMTYDMVWNDGLTVARVEGLILKAKLEETLASGDRVAAELGLPEGSGVDEVLARIKVRGKALDEYYTEFLNQKNRAETYKAQNTRLLEFRSSVQQALGLAPGTAEAVLLEGLKEKLGKLPPLETAFLEEMSLALGSREHGELRKTLNGMIRLRRRVTRLLNVTEVLDPDQLLEKVEEAYQVAQEKRTQNIENLEALDHLAQFIGHPGTTANHVVSETVSLIEKFLKVADLAGCKMDQPVSRIAEELRARYDGTEHTPLASAIKARDYWMKTSKAFEQRAFAAEAQLAGPPDDSESTVLRQFNRVVRRMHGIPSSVPHSEALATIAEYLDNVEKWRRVAAEAHEPATVSRVLTGSGITEPKYVFYPPPAKRRDPRKEGERLKVLRDDTNLDRETRRQAAYAYQMWAWFTGEGGPLTIAPSECLERGLPMLAEDERDYAEAAASISR